jgi:hypothetical protein
MVHLPLRHCVPRSFHTGLPVMRAARLGLRNRRLRMKFSGSHLSL